MTKSTVELFEFYGTENLQTIEMIKFLDKGSNFIEKFDYKMRADRNFVFNTLKNIVEDVVGEKAEFNFLPWSFFLKTSKVFMTVSYDVFGTKHRISGRYYGNIYSSDFDQVLEVKKKFEEATERLVINSVTWAISAPNESILYKSMDISGSENRVHQSFYPWLSKPLNEYYDAYLSSEETILLLMGVPGTGKTSFIRDFLLKNKLDSVITYDERLLRNDNFFLDFITSDESDRSEMNNDVLIIEDADTLIADREKSENSLLAKILNVSDGLVKNINKKIIFSTNITDVDTIDPALIRPGRCFDVLNFRKLNYEESLAVLDSTGKSREIEVDRKYTIAELLTDNVRDQHEKRKMGFS